MSHSTGLRIMTGKPILNKFIGLDDAMVYNFC